MTTEKQGAEALTPDEMLAVFGITEGEAYQDNNGEVRNPATGRIISGGDGADDALNVTFSVQPVLDKLATYRAGHNVYKDLEFVTIVVPGKRDVHHSPVTEYYKWRFPVDYANFKRGQAAIQTGTPLAMWPLITPSQAKELEHLGVMTVEQVASMSDSMAPQFMGFYALKTKAQQFLANTKDSAATASLQAELDARDAQHKSQMAAMQQQMAEMLAVVKQLSATKEEPADETAEEKPQMRFGKPVKPKAE